MTHLDHISKFLAVAIVAAFLGDADLQAQTTYTWAHSGDVANWNDTNNWAGGIVPPEDQKGAALVFSAIASGNLADNPSTAKATFHAITTNSSVRMNNFGNWNTNSQTGLIFDTGDGSEAEITVAGGTTFQTYYTPMTLDSDVIVTGGKWLWRAYGTRWGVKGAGGFIVQSGAEMEIDGTHGSDTFDYTGGVEVMSGGLVDLDAEMGSLGQGQLIIHEGGLVQAANTSFFQDVLFDINSTGTTSPFITGGGANWNVSGTWSFDLADAGTTVGNSWKIIGIGSAATYGSGFSVAGFVEASPGIWASTAEAANYTYATTNGVLKVVTGGVGGESNFDTWADSNGVPTGSEAVDSDSGGKNNLYEFALGGDPTDGNDDGALLHAFSAEVDGGSAGPEGVLTILVREGAQGTFVAAGNDQTADIDGITYTVAADTTVSVSGTVTVKESGTVVDTGLPSPPVGYEYASFYITGSEGYFRVTVAPE